MENEIRYYLGLMKEQITENNFEPKYMVTAVKLPTGAIEIAMNTECIVDKIDYILDAYDEDMHLKTNPEITMANLMIV